MGEQRSIGIRELRDRASDIVRLVREEGARYVITLHGRPVAVLRPALDDDIAALESDEVAAELAEWDALARDVSAGWSSNQTGVELVAEQRR